MAKINQREVLHILRLFELATPTEVPRDISRLQIIELTRSVVASFVFKNINFYILFDDYIQDEQTAIKETIAIAHPGVEIEVIANPKDDNHTYGMPYKAKTVYLAQNYSEKQRLDHYLVSKYPEFTRATIQKYIKEGYVSIDSKHVLIAKKLVRPGQDIVLTLPKKADNSSKTLPVIYEDDNVIVIDKPEGVLTHSKGALNDEFTVAEFISRFYADDLSEERPGIVHRLDRATSGVIICAKNADSAKFLRRQFSDRKAKKTYHAILQNVPKEKEAVIDLPIGRNMNNPSTFRVDAQGKPAVTHYKLLEVLPSGQASVEFRPVTGRTHQLRVHAQYLNAPIKGDLVYGKPDNRMYLHASELEITIPGGERLTFKSPIPESFYA